MDVRYINPFIAAIKNVFTTMVNTQVTIAKPILKPRDIVSADVSGVIGLSGDVTGAVVLSFPKDVACVVASKFAGVELHPDHPDFTDAIGELANMVAGDAKKDFTGINVSISLPSVICGPGHVVTQSVAAPQLLIPCKTEIGDFHVEVAMVVEKASTKKTQSSAVGVAS